MMTTGIMSIFYDFKSNRAIVRAIFAISVNRSIIVYDSLLISIVTMPPKNRYNNKKKGSRNGNKPSEKKSAATIAFPTAEADELTAYLDRLSLDVATSKKEGCYHGSSKAAFEKKEYNDAKSLLNTPGGQVQIGMMALYDADFQQYLFAQAIDEFFIFNANTSNAKRTAPKIPNRTVEKLLQQKEDWETQTKDLGRICKMAYFACSG